MEARSSPEGSGKKEGSRWIEGPTATASQPEDQPQMAHPHDNGNVPGAQSTVVSESGDLLFKIRRKKPSSAGHCASTVSVIGHRARDKSPTTAPTQERPTAMGQENDMGCSCSTQHPRPKDAEDNSCPRVDRGPETWPAFQSAPTRPITLIPVTKSQRSGEITAQPNDVEDKKDPGSSSAVAPTFDVIRVSSNPGPDGEDRLRRAFALLSRQAAKDRQDPLDEDYPQAYNSHQTPE